MQPLMDEYSAVRQNAHLKSFTGIIGVLLCKMVQVMYWDSITLPYEISCIIFNLRRVVVCRFSVSDFLSQSH